MFFLIWTLLSIVNGASHPNLDIVQLTKLQKCDQDYIQRLELENVECQVLYRGLGSLVGAAAGDSIGGRLEFWKPGKGFNPTPVPKNANATVLKKHNEELKERNNEDAKWFDAIKTSLYWKTGIKSWDQVKGGYHNLLAGETTDDTAMAISLSRGLINCKPQNFDSIQTNIFNQYHKWAVSNPFDIGFTTQDTIGTPKTVNKALQEASRINSVNVGRFGSGTLSNGALMRIMPLALYSYKLSNDEIHKLVKLDSDLTNSNQLVIDSVTAYVIVLRYLITNPKNENGKKLVDAAIGQAKSFLKKLVKIQNSDTPWHKFKDDSILKGKSAELVLKWLEPVDRMDDITIWKQLNDFYPYEVNSTTKSIGKGKFVKADGGMYFRVDVAIQRAFYWLKKASQDSDLSYVQILRYVIRECGNNKEAKGDTDTNAGIVGGLIGAYFGLTKIPKDYRKTLTLTNPSGKNHPDHNDHPVEDYQAKWYWLYNDKFKRNPLALLLIQKAPTSIGKPSKSAETDRKDEENEETNDAHSVNEEDKNDEKDKQPLDQDKQDTQNKEGKGKKGKKGNKGSEEEKKGKTNTKDKDEDKEDKEDKEDEESKAVVKSSYKYYIINLFLLSTFLFALFMFRR